MSLNSEDPNYYAHIYNESDSANKKIRILDSTLREGETSILEYHSALNREYR